MALVYAAITIIISIMICNKEIELATSNSKKFKKSLPLKYFGFSYGDFQHVFYHKKSLESEIIKTIENNLKTKTPIEKLETVELIDVDKNLNSSEKRRFIIADSGITNRGTSITLAIKPSSFGGMQSIRWWVLAGGYIDKDKKFNFIAYSPLSLPFWIISYIKNEYDVLANLRTIYPASYNDIDITTQVRCLHEAVFDAMVEELERNEIDTSDIKAQRMQVMSIHISEGKVNMGNVVQVSSCWVKTIFRKNSGTINTTLCVSCDSFDTRYAFAWLGHFFFEHNKPAAFTYPGLAF
jgi:hypothetical protein